MKSGVFSSEFLASHGFAGVILALGIADSSEWVRIAGIAAAAVVTIAYGVGRAAVKKKVNGAG